MNLLTVNVAVVDLATQVNDRLIMKIKKDIFRAYDIRGIVGEELTPDIVSAIGKAYGSEALAQGQHKIAVGRDGRLSGPQLSQALIEGILSTGCDVVNLGGVPSPVVYFSTYVLPGVQSGIVLTGSHNPANYNGLKMVIDHHTLSSDAIQGLYQRILKQDYEEGVGEYTEYNILPDYVDYIAKDIKLDRPLKVALDCGNGIGGCVYPELLERLGCKVIPLFCEVDGYFPNHHPDPSKPKNLKTLIEAVKEHQADIGLALDGDGDRLGVVTNKGEIIWPDRQLMLYAQDVLSRHPGSIIVYDVKCTKHLASHIQEYQGTPLMWKTGHSLIKTKMKETGALLAGEMSGHVFFKERWFGFDDALYTGCRLLEILSKETRDANTIFAALPNSVNTPELNVAVPDDKKFILLQHLVDNIAFEEAEVITIDGLRVEFKEGWGLVRASNTTPCWVIRFEADTIQNLDFVQRQFKQFIQSLLPELELDFGVNEHL